MIRKKAKKQMTKLLAPDSYWEQPEWNKFCQFSGECTASLKTEPGHKESYKQMQTTLNI